MTDHMTHYTIEAGNTSIKVPPTTTLKQVKEMVREMKNSGRFGRVIIYRHHQSGWIVTFGVTKPV